MPISVLFTTSSLSRASSQVIKIFRHRSKNLVTIVANGVYILRPNLFVAHSFVGHRIRSAFNMSAPTQAGNRSSLHLLNLFTYCYCSMSTLKKCDPRRRLIPFVTIVERFTDFPTGSRRLTWKETLEGEMIEKSTKIGMHKLFLPDIQADPDGGDNIGSLETAFEAGGREAMHSPLLREKARPIDRSPKYGMSDQLSDDRSPRGSARRQPGVSVPNATTRTGVQGWRRQHSLWVAVGAVRGDVRADGSPNIETVDGVQVIFDESDAGRLYRVRYCKPPLKKISWKALLSESPVFIEH